MRGPGQTDGRKVGRIVLVGYFLLTFAFTWTAWMVPAAFPAPGNAWFFGVGGPVGVSSVIAAMLLSRMRGAEIGATLSPGYAVTAT